jgi:hypothetical protein
MEWLGSQTGIGNCVVSLKKRNIIKPYKRLSKVKIKREGFPDSYCSK